MDERYATYEDDDVEMLRCASTVTVKIKGPGRFVEVDAVQLAPVSWRARQSGISGRGLTCYVVLLCAAVAWTTASSLREASQVGAGFFTWCVLVWLVVYSFFQLLLHELAHVLALRMFGRKPDRVGFKMNYWVFPAVYVRMNDTHLLTRSEKIVVHSAGLFVNAAIGAVAIWCVHLFELGDAGSFVVAWYAVTMLMNAVPILSSDGYRVLLAVCGVSERRRRDDNPVMVRAIGVVSVLCAAFYALGVASRLIGALR